MEKKDAAEFVRRTDPLLGQQLKEIFGEEILQRLSDDLYHRIQQLWDTAHAIGYRDGHRASTESFMKQKQNLADFVLDKAPARICDVCHGTGRNSIFPQHPCADCAGNGER